MIKEEKEHDCEYKKSNQMQDVETDCQGNCYCAKCRKQLNESQVHPNVFKRRR